MRRPTSPDIDDIDVTDGGRAANAGAPPAWLAEVDVPPPLSGSRRRPLRRVLHLAWDMLWMVIIAAAIALAVGWHVFGYVPMEVATGSMRPAFDPHDLVFVHQVPVASIKVGDVITFNPEGPVPRTSHRVVRIDNHDDHVYFRTKGDANNAIDDWLPPSKDGTQGVVPDYAKGITYPSGIATKYAFHIRYAGWVPQIVANRIVRLILVTVPLSLILIFLLGKIWRRPSDDIDDDGWDDARWHDSLEQRLPDASRDDRPPDKDVFIT